MIGDARDLSFLQDNSVDLICAHLFEKPKVSIHSSVRERDVDFSLLIPALEKPPLKRKLDAIETTTVWILPEKDFEECLIKM